MMRSWEVATHGPVTLELDDGSMLMFVGGLDRSKEKVAAILSYQGDHAQLSVLLQLRQLSTWSRLLRFPHARLEVSGTGARWTYQALSGSIGMQLHQ